MECYLEVSRPAQKSAILLLGYKMAMAVWRYHVHAREKASFPMTGRTSPTRPRSKLQILVRFVSFPIK